MEDSDNSLKFTETENKIRKRWLFWFILLPAFCLGVSVIFSMLIVFLTSSFIAMMWVFLYALFPAGLLYLHYYCAYKNPGTILLLLWMIWALLGPLFPLFNTEDLAAIKNLAVIKDLALLKVSALVSLSMVLFLEIMWFYYSYKLRRINKKMQERTLMSSAVYINALSVFSTATNEEELREQFAKLRTSDAAVPFLAKAYDQQKKTLKLVNHRAALE